MPDYMILRNAATVRTGSPFESFGPAVATAPAAPEPRVEVHDIITQFANALQTLAEFHSVDFHAKPLPPALLLNEPDVLTEVEIGHTRDLAVVTRHPCLLKFLRGELSVKYVSHAPLNFANQEERVLSASLHELT